jgi:hypothetical protein
MIVRMTTWSSSEDAIGPVREAHALEHKWQSGLPTKWVG